jgi:hypothetical protein
MGMKYLLSCLCGRQHTVQTSQAGDQVDCPCGERIEVPTLRELSQLPAVRPESAATGQQHAGWSRRQGILFVAGALLLILAAASVVLIYHALPPQTLPGRNGVAAGLDARADKLTPAETLQLWLFYKNSPGMMVALPERLEAAERKRTLLVLSAWLSGVLCSVSGLICLVFSLRSKK